MKLNRRQFNFSLAMLPFLGKLFVPKEEEYVYCVTVVFTDSISLSKVSKKTVSNINKLKKRLDDNNDLEYKIIDFIWFDRTEILENACAFLDFTDGHNYKTGDILPLNTSGVYVKDWMETGELSTVGGHKVINESRRYIS